MVEGEHEGSDRAKQQQGNYLPTSPFSRDTQQRIIPFWPTASEQLVQMT